MRPGVTPFLREPQAYLGRIPPIHWGAAERPPKAWRRPGAERRDEERGFIYYLKSASFQFAKDTDTFYVVGA